MDKKPKEESVRVSAQALKQHFLDSAWPIVDAYIDAALGKEELKSLNSSCREEVWDLIKALMLQSSDKLDLNIENPEDVLQAVEQGKCTFEEAKKLLELYKQVKDIKLSASTTGGASGVTVNILNAPAKADALQIEVIDE